MAWKYEGNGKWVEVYEKKPTNTSNKKPTSTSNKKPTNSGSSSNKKPTSSSGSSSNKNSNQTTETKDEATKEYIELEDNVLEGDLTVIPNVSYRAKSTILLQYLGKNLTGLYHVDKVTHSFSSNSGYEQTLTVSKNGFGDSIKRGNTTTPVPAPPKEEPRKEPVKPPTDGEIPINKWGTVTPKKGLNIRRDPSTKNPRITAMPKGTRVYCVSKKGEWYRVEWKSYKGWSHGSYIKLDK